jgi:chromosomal replication initiator protein
MQNPSVQEIPPEAMPAETDPPSPNWFVVLASEPKRSDYPSIRDIQKEVCKYYDVKLIDMLSGRRSAWIAMPRQVAYFLSKELTLHSLPQIGRRFGGRDHSSVHHGVAKIKLLCPRDAVLAHDIAK